MNYVLVSLKKLTACLVFLILLVGLTNGISEDVSTNANAGIGVTLAANGTNILVMRILPNTVGATDQTIHVGDRIIAVAQESEPAINVQRVAEAAQLIRGPKGSTVCLTIVPAGEDAANQKVISFRRGEINELLDWGDGILLTNGTRAPNIELTRLPDSQPERLFDHTGKIIVLEFWATWCAPCQRAMAELESFPSTHPDWSEKVMIIAASVDDSPDTAVNYLKQKGWNQTHNVLAGPAVRRAYHVEAIPVVYVIDQKGKVAATNPVDLESTVNQLVQEASLVAKPAADVQPRARVD